MKLQLVVIATTFISFENLHREVKMGKDDKQTDDSEDLRVEQKIILE
jgi:hypothetical protein